MGREIKPFKVQIPDSELELLRKKVALARLPEGLSDSEWGEESPLTLDLMRETVKHWQTAYDWRAQEAKINQMPQFKTVVAVDGFDLVEVHFVHAKAAAAKEAIPLLFLHGWPGSFVEVQPMLPILLEAGFDVVAPSLMGYGFSGYPRQAGFTFEHHAQAYNMLMKALNYDSYVVQGGDLGSVLGRAIAILFPESVKALHLNMLLSIKAYSAQPAEVEELTPTEKECLARSKRFRETQSAYQQVHATKTRTFGYAMHDSPVGMLAWMADKLLLWSDIRAKKWTPDELITWTLLHYLPGPTTGMLMYRENTAPGTLARITGPANRIAQPVGFSHFPRELIVAPRSWAEEENNIVWWRQHDEGGHFAAYEKPAELAADLIEFFQAHWVK